MSQSDKNNAAKKSGAGEASPQERGDGFSAEWSQTPATASHALDSERAILGALLANQDGGVVWDILQESSVGLERKHFFARDHQRIFSAISEISGAAPGTADPITVAQRMHDLGFLSYGEKVKGKTSDEYLCELADIGGTPVNIVPYAKLVIDAYNHRFMRKAILQASEMFVPGSESFRDDETFAVRMDRFQQGMYRAVDEVMTQSKSRLKTAGEVAQALVKRMQNSIETDDYSKWEGMLTGVGNLDEALQGLRGGELLVIAARPGCGKTAFAIHIAIHAIARLRRKNIDAGVDKSPGCYFMSAEMQEDDIVGRMLGMLAPKDDKMNFDSMSFSRTGGKHEKNKMQLLSAGIERANQLSVLPLVIDDRADINIAEVRNSVYRAARSKDLHPHMSGIGIIIVDYVQLLGGDGKYGRHGTRTDEIGSVSRGLKAMAKELDVPVVALSQLNREKEKGIKKRDPMLSDIRDSGQIEQDADAVLFMDDDPDLTMKNTAAPPLAYGDKRINFILAKNRHGPNRVKWYLDYIPSQTRFRPPAKTRSNSPPAKEAGAPAPHPNDDF